MRIYLLLLIILSISLSSCGLMFNPTHEKVLFNSKPQGMSVLINDSLHGTTPLLATLSKKKDHYVKYKNLDSLVYSDTIKSRIHLRYILMDLFFPTNIFIYTAPLPFFFDGISQSYKELDKNIISFNYNQSSIISDSTFETSKNGKLLFKNDEDLREYAIRFEVNQFYIHLKNGEVRKNYMILGLDDDKNLICALNNPIEYDPNDFRQLIIRDSEKEYILIDSIDAIVLENPISGRQSFRNTILGFVIGAATGLGIAFMGNPKPREMEGLLHVAMGAGGGLIGLIVGFSTNSPEYYYYILKDKNHGQKVEILKQLLLFAR